MSRLIPAPPICALAAVFGLLSSLAPSAAFGTTPVSGRVVDQEGRPLAGVSIRHTFLGRLGPRSAAGPEHAATTDGDGRFSFDNLGGQMPLDGGGDIGDIALEQLSPIDNEDYEWVKPIHPKADRSDFGCNACHGEQAEQWEDSTMAKSATDEWVLSLYEGTDIDGALAGDGYRIDNPDKAGPCADCHAPAAAIKDPGNTVLSEVEGVALQGVFCDVCHKIADVVPGAGPGVSGSIKFARPSAWLGLFAFGPYEDVGGGPMTSSYSPLIKTSRFCAGCHEWTNDAGVPVMSTYSEWSEVSGADPDALQCQDCHMKKKFGRDYRGEPEPVDEYILDDDHVQRMHGVLRSSATRHPHEFHGADEYAKEAADLFVDGRREGGELVVEVEVENTNAGHALPTGMPFRHALLVVEVSGNGFELDQTGGPVVPAWGGEGDSDRDLAGLPGKGYAKVLGDGTGAVNVPFWRATEVIEDTRVRGGDSDTVTLTFAVPEGVTEAVVKARLVYRKAFIDMARIKRWAMEDIEMAAVETELDVTPTPDDEVVADGQAGDDAGNDVGEGADVGDAGGPAGDGAAAGAGDDGPAGEVGDAGRSSGCACGTAGAAAKQLLGFLRR